MNGPFTYAAFWQWARDTPRTPQNRRVRVQVKKSGVTYCAQIQEMYTASNGLECYVVQTSIPESARFVVACKNVRLCHALTCTCEAPGAVIREGFSPHDDAAGKTLPEGLTCL